MKRTPKQEYSAKEAAERLTAALRGARVVGHKPQSDMKLGRRRASGPKPKRPPKKAAD